MARTQIPGDEILDFTIFDADVNSAAAIAFSKLAALPSGQILVGSAGNVPTARTVTGDVSISNTGDVQISAGAIVNADVNASAAIAGTKISADFGAQNLIVDTNVLFVDSVNNRVGIGTASPPYPLSVEGSIAARSGSFFLAFAPSNANYLQIQHNGSYAEFTNTLGHIVFPSPVNFGIGTSSPNSKLTVQSPTAGSYAGYFQGNGTNSQSFGLQVDAGTTSSDYAVRVRHVLNATEYLAVRGDGNVGVGTASPAQKLHVAGTARFDGRLYIDSSAVNVASIASGTVTMRFESDARVFNSQDSGLNMAGHLVSIRTNSADRLYVDSAGNVGIGVASPSQMLHLAQGGRIQIGSASSNSGASIRFLGSNANRNWLVGNQETIAGLEFTPSTAGGGSTFTTPAMVILDSGNVGIGTSVPDGKFSIKSSGTGTYGGLVFEDDGSAGEYWAINPNASNDLVFWGYDGGWLERVTFRASGNVGIGTISPAASALLDLTSTTQGLLPPRMTTTQKNAISSPATGLVVYDSTLATYQFYNGSGWQSMGGATPAGSTGAVQFNNAGNLAADTSNFFWDNTVKALGIGTSSTGNYRIALLGGTSGSLSWGGAAVQGILSYDVGKAHVLAAASNALSLGSGGVIDRVYLDTTGNLGIGTTSPASKLSVGASSEFQVASNGNLIKVRNVTYSWPASQGSSNTALINDGSGNLSWGSAGHTIHDEGGAALTQRPALNFTGSGVTATDDSGNNRTNVTIPGNTEIRQNFVATGGQTLFTLSTAYQFGQNNLRVYRNGALQTPGAGNDYNETNSTQFTFLNGCSAGDSVSAVYLLPATAITQSVPGTEYRQAFTATGSPQTFTLSNPYLNNGTNLRVFVNGSLQKPSTNYSEDNATQFTFSTGLTSGDTVEAIWTGAATGVVSYTPATETRQDFTGDGTTATFSLTGGRTFTQGGENLKVYVDGVLQRLGGSNDYTEPSNSQVTFNAGNIPSSGQVVSLVCISQIGALGSFKNRRTNLVASAGQTVFEAGFTFVMGGDDLLVYNDGVLMLLGEDYYELNNTQVVFFTARQTGSKVALVGKVQAAAGDANSVNGISASITPTAGKLVPLDVNAQVPISVLSNAVQVAMLFGGN